MSEQIINIDGIEICTESFGNPIDPPILLIMGATASMICWEDEFCQRLANKGRYVIRYDNRDVGRSATYPLGHPEYSLEDLADDGVRLVALIYHNFQARIPEPRFSTISISSSIRISAAFLVAGASMPKLSYDK